MWLLVPSPHGAISSGGGGLLNDRGCTFFALKGALFSAFPDFHDKNGLNTCQSVYGRGGGTPSL